MKTTILQQDGNIVAVLEGRLDTAAAATTEKDLLPLYDCDVLLVGEDEPNGFAGFTQAFPLTAIGMDINCARKIFPFVTPAVEV